MLTLQNPKEVSREEEQGKVKMHLMERRSSCTFSVLLTFTNPKQCRRLARKLHEAALQMERAQDREGGK